MSIFCCVNDLSKYWFLDIFNNPSNQSAYYFQKYSIELKNSSKKVVTYDRIFLYRFRNLYEKE